MEATFFPITSISHYALSCFIFFYFLSLSFALTQISCWFLLFLFHLGEWASAAAKRIMSGKERKEKKKKKEKSLCGRNELNKSQEMQMIGSRADVYSKTHDGGELLLDYLCVRIGKRETSSERKPLRCLKEILLFFTFN